MLIVLAAVNLGLACPPWHLWSPERYQAERSAKIRMLIRVAEPKLALSDYDARPTVACLGVMRAVEAVPLLVEHLTYTPTHLTPGLRIGQARDIGPEAGYPSAYALAKIGPSCLDKVISKICQDDSEKALLCAAIVFHNTLGNDDSILLLRARAAGTHDPHRTKRIGQLIKVIDEKMRDNVY